MRRPEALAVENRHGSPPELAPMIPCWYLLELIFLGVHTWNRGDLAAPPLSRLLLASQRVISVAGVVHRVCGAISRTLYYCVSVLSPVEWTNSQRS